LSFNNVDYTASTFNTAGGPLDDGTTYVEFSRGHTGGPLNGAQVVADVTFDVTADSGSEAEIMFDLTRTFAILAGTGQAVSTSNSRYTI